MSALAAVDAFDEYALDRTRARATALGITLPPYRSPESQQFPCVLPDHDHLARLHWHAKKNCWRYVCVAASYGLSEVRAAKAGRLRISDLEAARWAERLDYEAGLRTPRRVGLVVPADASKAAEAVADGLALFLGLRDERWGRQEFAFAFEFRSAYCGVTAEAAQRGMKELEARKAIVRVAKRPIPGSPYPAVFWRLPNWPPRLAVVA